MKDDNNSNRNLLEYFLRYLSDDSEKSDNNNVLYGAVSAGTHLLITSFANFGQRVIAKEGIFGDEQNIWMGVFNFIPAFCVM